MQRLGLTPAELRDYHALLLSPHDFVIEVAVLDMEEKVKSSLRVLRERKDGPGFIDGQINIQREGDVKRTASLVFYDPERTLHLDPDSPFAGAMFADRMIRVRHIVTLPGHGKVVATPFVGVIANVSREGDDLTVVCNDKTVLALEGCEPKTVKKGRNAVAAIEDIMRDCTGERRFRFPKGNKRRLTRSYSVGWKSESSPWRVCQKIAKDLNMQLVYASDGALMLRRKPRRPFLTFTEARGLTGALRSEYDISQVRNIVRVSGLRNKKKKIRIGAVARPKWRHPLSPQKLGRHGVPRYLPLLIDDSGIKKHKVAQKRANDELKDALPMGVRASFPGAPLFHLDYSDPIRISSDFGDATVPFVEGSLPIGLGGDAQYGSQKMVSRPRRRFR